ncbi:hypothetical protein AJ78_02052 [Emergomyces pasteurianus Ep9510]|uniref:Major facilitator superfamily (MFS) profile domain-containing protein n=1 Tax=Emergomyces pasteurianus Ep9510 TaxID=1447872 RepID=A0A1J9PN08_9EURO|nr:hypothetical protein AJ78_02052 [Emergomyces pasteurianus Ep9510]
MDPLDSSDRAVQNLTHQLDKREVGKGDVIQDERRSQQQEFSYPPADGGTHAWLFLAGCFFIEALLWITNAYAPDGTGFPFTFGLFQDYYTRHEPFKSDPSGIPAIGTSALGIMYLGSPLSFAAVKYWPLVRRWSIAAGLALLTLSLVTASFANNVPQLIATQGIIYGIGGAVIYSPVIVFVDEWFVRRRGLAYGVVWAGTGFSGVLVPFVTSWLLQSYSFQTTLRVWAITLGVLSGPLLAVVKPRIPESQKHQTRYIELRFIKERPFVILQLGNIFQSLGYFMPTVYLPSYARSIGAGNTAVTATVSLLNSAMMFGCIFIGILIDRFHVTTAILVCTLGATISTFVFWGVAMSTPLLCVFSILYGFFAGGFSSTYAGVIKETRKVNPGADPGIVFGMIAAGRGVGSVICGPLSETLMRKQSWVGRAALGYGTAYGPLIVFTGVTALLGGVSFSARRLGWI